LNCRQRCDTDAYNNESRRIYRNSAGALLFFGKTGEEAMAAARGLSGENGDRIMMIKGRMLRPEDRIHDLWDELEDAPRFPARGLSGVRTAPERIYDLVDVIERKPKMALVDTGLRDEIVKRAEEIAEKIAREMIPGIAERVIREEIERLKKGL